MADPIFEHMMILRSQLVQEVIKLEQKRTAALRNIKDTDRMLLGRDPSYRPDEVVCASPEHHEPQVPQRRASDRPHRVREDKNNPWRDIMPLVYRIIREGGNHPVSSDFIFQQLRQHFNIRIQGNNPSRVLLTRLERDPELIDCSEHHFALAETSKWLKSALEQTAR